MENSFVKEARQRMAAEKAKNMRYRRPMLASLGWETIESELNDMEEACGTVHYFIDDDEDSLVAALDGDEDEAYEFRMVFADVEAKCDMLRSAIDELDTGDDYIEDFFNTCTVALIGNRYDVLGFDTYQEDYYSLSRYEADLATTKAGERLMRMTKAEMISAIGQCMGIALAFADIKTQYDSISAAMAVLRNENTSILKIVKEIEEAYERCQDDWRNHDKEFDRLLECLPEKAWIQ